MMIQWTWHTFQTALIILVNIKYVIYNMVKKEVYLQHAVYLSKWYYNNYHFIFHFLSNSYESSKEWKHKYRKTVFYRMKKNLFYDRFYNKLTFFLHYWYILLNMFLEIYDCLSPINIKENWMTLLNPFISKKRLGDLTWPGSHDSATKGIDR